MVAAIESTGVTAVRTAGLSDSVLADRIKSGASLLYTEYPFGGHDVWTNAYNHPLLLPWVFSKSRSATSTLMYVRSVEVAPLTPQVRQDTVTIRATVNNPEGHTLAVSALVNDWGAGLRRDSLQLLDDGNHGDGLAGDGIWARTVVPTSEGVYSITVRAVDLSMARSSVFADAAFYATAGPISIKSVVVTAGDTSANPGDALHYLILLKNRGSSYTVRSVTAVLTSQDPAATILSNAISYGDLPAGAVSAGSGLHAVQYAATRPGTYLVPLTIEILSFGVLMWSDEFVEEVTAVPQAVAGVPRLFSLAQNYPNPFNPTTVVRYQLPVVSNVNLVVYDVLGREVAMLVNRVEDPGYKSVEWNASGVASGVYFYRLQAGNFVQTRKLLLLR
jgi:hypothetical protein